MFISLYSKFALYLQRLWLLYFLCGQKHNDQIVHCFFLTSVLELSLQFIIYTLQKRKEKTEKFNKILFKNTWDETTIYDLEHS